MLSNELSDEAVSDCSIAAPSQKLVKNQNALLLDAHPSFHRLAGSGFGSPKTPTHLTPYTDGYTCNHKASQGLR